MFDLEVASENREQAEATLKAACEKLLANTVVENYTVEIA
ncbi:Phosphoribosylformylglycinamidine synthetase PurS (fragment) [Methylorubrum extorquens]|uniref:Phosphoribosylformylglycinamidine synthetase PurS n=1 Tax=Methylorubrum extorquens TaxID=408 RepID=A0A2N9AYA2_METEX